ncbi:FAD-dependent oxidoreductase [Herbiconiux ginsengi]|uniref:2-polyprenyl-6-methoxyphenol hydroxylase n=1 Tax=Herbiconiux ginsengi TaxID=381665 RepID=A0A1H3PIW0_9MICO|nr:NAD(P)/FAD-dependent oxidoreductase [Herbiconiux ginsengi]SDZ01044.1 2-polyprenyl-6-methoxyphenol hydroxylase [Herbiconiux ginsengi]
MHDVAVVGAGPAGLFLAAALAQRGIDVVVLERRGGPRLHSRAIGIHPPSLAALDRLGVLDAVLAAGVRIDRGILRIDGEVVAELEFGGVPEPFPFVVSLPQVATERILRSQLATGAPDALRGGVRVERFQHHAGGVAVLGHTARGDGLRVDARLVVGADGPLSLVRAAARIRDTVYPYPYRYVMGDVIDQTSEGPVAVLHLHPKGIVESFPLPGGRRRWVTHLPAGIASPDGALPDSGETNDPGVAAELSRLILERTGIVTDPRTSTMTSVFGVRRRTVPRMGDGRMLLIGDAAHEVSPIGGQGMNLGWLDAEALAGLMPELLAAPKSARSRASGLLRDFERTRLRSAARASRTAEFNMLMGRPTSALGFAARRLVVRAAAAPALHDRLARAFTMHSL